MPSYQFIYYSYYGISSYNIINKLFYTYIHRWDLNEIDRFVLKSIVLFFFIYLHRRGSLILIIKNYTVFREKIFLPTQVYRSTLT